MSEPTAEAVVTLDEVYADIVGVWEVAQLLGVPKSRVHRWIERRDSTGCPKPVKELKAGNLFSLAEWKGWYSLWRLTRGAQPAPAPTRPAPSAATGSGGQAES